jgi:hypothetical protein
MNLEIYVECQANIIVFRLGQVGYPVLPKDYQATHGPNYYAQEA